MSRISISAFLSKSKNSLSQSIRSKGEHPASFVIGNQSADLDSITCALVYGYIKSSTPEARKADKYIIPIANIPSSELKLRPELTALLKHADLKPSDLITLDDLGKLHEILPAERTDWTLVDHNVLLGDLGEHFSKQVTGVIDHHDDEGKVPQDAEPRVIEKTGSCNSHVINYSRENWDSLSSGKDATKWDAEVAKLALGAILIDTVDLKAKDKVTDHDRQAVDYLESKIAASNEHGEAYNRDAFFKEINDAKSDLDALSLEEILRKDYKQWNEKSLILGISSCVRSIEYLMEKEKQFTPALMDFANERKLDLYAVMTSHNDSGDFARQLLLIAVTEGEAVKVVEKFVKQHAEEAQLEESKTKLDECSAKWIRLWEQKNLAASRKQIAPMLREAMG